MSKNKKAAGVFLTLLAGVLAVVSIIAYRSVANINPNVYYMLGGAIVLAVIAFLIAGKLPRLAGYFPICVAALLGSAAVWGAKLMVNELGWAVAGLNEWSTLTGFIVFIACAVVGMLFAIIAAFLPMTKKA